MICSFFHVPETLELNRLPINSSSTYEIDLSPDQTYESIMTFQQPDITDPFYYHQFPYGDATGLDNTSTFCSGGQHDVEGREWDEFLMYTFKVRRCMWTDPHLWTECPFAHPGETAQRRDPCKFPYHGIPCPDFRQKRKCRRGQKCRYGHGDFEIWLHPTRYHTRLCRFGLRCTRPVCFFAHRLERLRPGPFPDGHPMDPWRSKRPTAAATSSSAGDEDDELYDLPHIDDLIEELLE